MTEREYKLTYDHTEFCVIALEVRDRTGPAGEPRVYLPACKLPHRPYPLGAYLYAIQLYSSQPAMGQRGAARETRKLFGLETFSHTTLGRAIIAMAGRIGKNDGPEKPDERPGIPSEPAEAPAMGDEGDPPESPGTRAHAGHKGRFPGTADTGETRRRIFSFLRERLKPQDRNAFMAACGELALEWHFQTKCLLL